MELEELIVGYKSLITDIEDIGEALKLNSLKERLQELESIQHSEDFWSDMKRATSVSQEAKRISNKLEGYQKLLEQAKEGLELAKMALELEEIDAIETLVATLNELVERKEEMRLATYLIGEYDDCDCILTLHAGAGGTEAQDWVSMLFRMYTRYSEKKGYKMKTIDLLPGEEAGIKSVTFELSGEGMHIYGYMKAEKGVHRLVRISPFDANSRRHTSFASLEVMPVIPDDGEIEIRPEDLKIDTYRSSGAGGQHVNRTDSAVRITHIPTGIITQCQNERSQVQNREVAMTMLRAKLAEKKEQENQERANEIKGKLKKIEWGSQIRSYVFCPYTLVKDHRTGYETGNVTAVMDGELDGFITEYLKQSI